MGKVLGPGCAPLIIRIGLWAPSKHNEIGDPGEKHQQLFK